MYPSELENILLSHPAVVDAAVVGESRPNNGHGNNEGEVPCGFVVVAPSGDQATPAVTEKELFEFARLKLESHKELQWDMKIIETVPRSPAGKIRRRELKKMAVGI